MHRARLSIALIYFIREKTITCTVPGFQSLQARRPLHARCQAFNPFDIQQREDHYMHDARLSIPSIYNSEKTITCTMPGFQSLRYTPARGPLMNGARLSIHKHLKQHTLHQMETNAIRGYSLDNGNKKCITNTFVFHYFLFLKCFVFLISYF